MKKKYISNSPDQTKKIGRNISKLLDKNNSVLLSGALGSGKTVLVKGICDGLKVKDFVNSPSFKIVSEYSGILPVYHIDLYRLNSQDEINRLGIDDYLYGNGVTLIEWAEKLGRGTLPEHGFKINIKIKKDDTRLIELENFNYGNSCY